MAELSNRLKILRPLIEQQGHKIDIVRLERIPLKNLQSIVEKMKSYNEAEFYISGNITCNIFTQEHHSSDTFDELYMLTIKTPGKKIDSYQFEIIPFINGKLQQFFLQYTNMICQDISLNVHKDSKSGFDLSSRIVQLSLKDSRVNVLNPKYRSDFPKITMHVFESKKETESKRYAVRTKAYQIFTERE